MLTWIAGAYVYSDKTSFPPPYQFVIATPPGSLTNEYLLDGDNPVSAVAGFGQLSFQLPAGWQLQIGGRYTADKTTNHVRILQYGLPLSDEQSQKFVNTSGKVSLNWNVNPDNFLYAGRDILGGQVAWAHARFVTTLYGTNLTNQHYVGALNSGLRFAGPPRQYGVRFLTTF